MVSTVIPIPPPKEVAEARRLIHEAVDRLPFRDVLRLADQLRIAESHVLLAGLANKTGSSSL